MKVISPTLESLIQSVDKMRGESAANRKITTDLLGDLSKILVALDKHTDGAITSELATTVMGFMMEELDGNTF
jgi:hypothetical protein